MFLTFFVFNAQDLYYRLPSGIKIIIMMMRPWLTPSWILVAQDSLHWLVCICLMIRTIFIIIVATVMMSWWLISLCCSGSKVVVVELYYAGRYNKPSSSVSLFPTNAPVAEAIDDCGLEL